MSDLNALVTQNAALVVGGLVLVIAAPWPSPSWSVARRGRRLEARLEALTRGEDGRDLAGVLDAHLAKVLAVARRQDELDAHAVLLETQAGRSVQGVGFVRFNNFEDTGGNQSFALALARPGRRRGRRQQPPRAQPDAPLREGRPGGRRRGRALRRGGRGDPRWPTARAHGR